MQGIVLNEYFLFIFSNRRAPFFVANTFLALPFKKSNSGLY